MKALFPALISLLIGAAPATMPITLGVQSWGQPIIRWTIMPDGGIAYADHERGMPPGQLTARHAPPSPPRYAWVARMLASARARAGKEMPCTSTATDMPYGDVAWGDGAGAPRLSFQFGCKEAGTAALVDRLGTITTQVKTWAEKGSQPSAPVSQAR